MNISRNTSNKVAFTHNLTIWDSLHRLFFRIFSKILFLLIDFWHAFFFQMGSTFWNWPVVYELNVLLTHKIYFIFEHTQPREQGARLYLMVMCSCLGYWGISLFWAINFVKFQMVTFFSSAVGDICLGLGKLSHFMCKKSLWTTHFNRFQ